MKNKYSFWSAALIVIFAMVQMSFVLIFYRKGAYVDQWDLVPILDQYLSGGNWLDLALAQHGGHYHTTAYLIMLPLAKLSNWNLLYETIVLLLLNLVSFALLYQAYLKDILLSNTNLAFIICTSITALYFALGHGGNALWSWQLCVYLCIFGLCLTLSALSATKISYASLGLAALGGTIASFSYSCGFAVWPVGLLILVLRTDSNRKTWPFIAIWILIGLLISFYYLLNIHNTGMSKAYQFDISDTLIFMLYYLGTPIAYFSKELSLIIVAVGLATFCYLAIKLFPLLKAQQKNGYALILALAAFSLISGLLICIGRLGFGVEQARSFRYLIFSQFFWFSLLLLIWLHAKTAGQSLFKANKKSLWPLYLILVLVVFNSQKMGRANAKNTSQDNALYHQLLTSKPNERPSLLSDLNYPSREILLNHLSVLERNKLNFYRLD